MGKGKTCRLPWASPHEECSEKCALWNVDEGGCELRALRHGAEALVDVLGDLVNAIERATARRDVPGGSAPYKQFPGGREWLR